MSLDNVVSITGDEITVREANEAVIAALEDLMDLAKAGEIHGVSAAFAYVDGSASYVRSGAITNAMLGAATRVQSLLVAHLEEAYE